MAALIEAKIVELEAQRADSDARDERRRLNRLLHQNKELLRWCQTRVSYRPVAATPDADGTAAEGARA
jgi:hypothetical protein